MNRLQTELHRLYFPQGTPAQSTETPGLIDPAGQVRAMVMALLQPMGGSEVAALWHRVQDELGLPAPAMAVSGIDGFQIWFSLAAPVPVAQAQAFLENLRLRYLGNIAPECIRIHPTTDATRPQQWQHAVMVPARQAENDHWSAFVVPGLASMFADEPWLDRAPSPDAQADLLMHLKSILPADFLLAQARLKPAIGRATDALTVTGTEGLAGETPPANSALDPKRFLLAVMNDPTAELGLRIEAAKVLLPYFEGKSPEPLPDSRQGSNRKQTR